MSTSDAAQQSLAQSTVIRDQMRATIVQVAELQQDASDEMGRRAPASGVIDDEWLVANDISLLQRAEAEARLVEARDSFMEVISHVGWAQRMLIPYALADDERDESIETHLPSLAPEAVSAVQYHIAIERRLRAEPEEYLRAMQSAAQTAETAILVAKQHRTELTERLNDLHGLGDADEDGSEV